MQCAFCKQLAERSCTRCGRFFCPAHGGDRLVEEGAGDGYQVVTRGVCDKCTPDQNWIKSKQRLGLIVFLVALLVMLGFCLFDWSRFPKF
jgi:hypothetical protein